LLLKADGKESFHIRCQHHVGAGGNLNKFPLVTGLIQMLTSMVMAGWWLNELATVKLTPEWIQ